jgi:uncharacterized protein
MSKNALLLLGGTWHAFEAFRQWLTPLLADCGYDVLATYDMDALLRLEGVDLVVQYTSYGVHPQFPEAVPGLANNQAQALADWVAGGGKLLGVHSATVVGPEPNPIQEALLGARFIEHPPQFAFTVYPVARAHPLIADVEAFTVHDEFYMQAYGDDIAIHMMALDRGQAHPMVWTRPHGAGAVAYIGMGHSAAVWALPPYDRLLRNAVGWLETVGQGE